MSGQCCGNGQQDGIPIKIPDGLRIDILYPKVFGTGYLPQQKKKRMAGKEKSPCFKNRPRQYSGISKSEPTLIRMTRTGSRISNPAGVRKCCGPRKVAGNFTVSGYDKMACVQTVRNQSQ